MSGQSADAHLKRHGPPSEAVVVAVTNGHLDGSAERSPKSWARRGGSSEARQEGWPVSLDGRRRRRVPVKITGEWSG